MTDASPEIVIARALANRRAHIYGAEAWVDDPALWRSHEFVTDTAAILSALDAAGYVIAPKVASRKMCAIIAEGWETVAAGQEYMTSGNGRFWDAGTHYDQGRADAASDIRGSACCIGTYAAMIAASQEGKK